MSDTINKRDFQFKDVEKYKKEEINNENIRNLLKILFPEGKIEIITKYVKNIEKIKKTDNRDKKIQEINKSENNCENNENKETQEISKSENDFEFLSDISDEEIENCNNEELILEFIFKYYLKQFRNGDFLEFIKWLNYTNKYIENKKGDKKYFIHNKELLNTLLYLKIKDKKDERIDIKDERMDIKDEFLLNFVKIAEALKFKKIFSKILERSGIINNILKDLNDKIKNNLENKRSYFEAYKNIIEYDKENITNYENSIYSIIEVLSINELLEFKNFIKAINEKEISEKEKFDTNLILSTKDIIEQCCSFLLNKYESNENYLKIIEENLEDIIQYCIKNEDKIKLLEILSELVETECEINSSVDQITLFNNLLSGKTRKNIEKYKKELYSLYFANFESKKLTNDTDIENLKEIINYLEFSIIKEFIDDYIKKEGVNYNTNVEKIKKCLYGALLKNNFLQQLNIENCKELINILETDKYNNLMDTTKIKECLYGAYFDKLNNEQIIEDEFSKLKLDDYEKLIKVLETKKYNNLKNIIEIKGKLYFYYIKKMKEEKYDDKKIENFIEKYDDKKIENFIEKYIVKNISIYTNVLTHLKEEIIKNKQKGNFLTILTDNIDTISKIIKYQSCTFSSFETIENIIKDEKINKDEKALKLICSILLLNVPEEENKKEEFLKNFAFILQMEVNIDNKKCTLAEVVDTEKNLLNYFKEIKENLKKIPNLEIFRKFYFNNEKDEKYKDSKKLPARSKTVNIGETKKQDINNNKITRSETVNIGETTKQNNTITQDTGIKKGKSFFSFLSIFSKDKNTNNNEQSSQLKRTNTLIID